MALREGGPIRSVGKPLTISSRPKPYYTKVDLRAVMANYHKASEDAWGQAEHPSVIKSTAREFLSVLKRVPQYKGHRSLARLKRAGNWKELEAALDEIWLYAEKRRVLLIA